MTAPPCTLRRARPEDSDAVSALAFAAKAALGYSPAQMDLWRDDLRIDPRQFVVWLLEAAQGPVAVVAWTDEGPTVVLEHLWVAPPHQRRGLGRRLMAHALQHARQRGAHRMTIDAEPSAAAFYAGCGAAPTGAVAAPISGQPGRSRPQFEIDLSLPR